MATPADVAAPICPDICKNLMSHSLTSSVADVYCFSPLAWQPFQTGRGGLDVSRTSASDVATTSAKPIQFTSPISTATVFNSLWHALINCLAPSKDRARSPQKSRMASRSLKRGNLYDTNRNRGREKERERELERCEHVCASPCTHANMYACTCTRACMQVPLDQREIPRRLVACSPLIHVSEDVLVPRHVRNTTADQIIYKYRAHTHLRTCCICRHMQPCRFLCSSMWLN